MPEYAVNVVAEYYVTYIVEADNEDQANEIACDMFCDEHNNDWAILTCDPEEIVDETNN